MWSCNPEKNIFESASNDELRRDTVNECPIYLLVPTAVKKYTWAWMDISSDYSETEEQPVNPLYHGNISESVSRETLDDFLTWNRPD